MGKKTFVGGAFLLTFAVLLLRPERNPSAVRQDPGPLSSAPITKVIQSPVRRGNDLLDQIRELEPRPETKKAYEKSEILYEEGKKRFSFISSLYAIPDSEVPESLRPKVRQVVFGFALLESDGEIPEGGSFVLSFKNRFALATGNVLLHLAPKVNPEAVAKDHGVAVQSSIPRLASAIFRVNAADAASLMESVETLRSDERVVRADLELVQGRLVPQ